LAGYRSFYSAKTTKKIGFWLVIIFFIQPNLILEVKHYGFCDFGGDFSCEPPGRHELRLLHKRQNQRLWFVIGDGVDSYFQLPVFETG
jgi:hypothetical protein